MSEDKISGGVCPEHCRRARNDNLAITVSYFFDVTFNGLN